jgi:hypothetical protein
MKKIKEIRIFQTRTMHKEEEKWARISKLGLKYPLSFPPYNNQNGRIPPPPPSRL